MYTSGKESKVVKTACQLCLGRCGINVHIKDGRIVRIEGMPEHPVSQGKICIKGRSLAEWVYSPNRLRHPMRRRNGEWEPISWDEALDTIASRLKELKEAHGARALAVCFGFIFLTQGLIAAMDLVRRFTDIYGTPNVFSVDSMCYRHRLIAQILTGGRVFIADPENAKCILLWGHNPNNSNPPLAWRILDSKRKGAKLIVVDPRRTSLAKRADIHVQPRPGTDGALLLGILNVIISEGLCDKEFVVRWTVGLDSLAEHIKSYAPEKVERISWVTAETIREIARTYATIKPACIIQGTNTLDQQPSGIQNSRAVAILHAITGNLDIPGGYVTPPGLRENPMRLPDMLTDEALTVDKYPLFYEVLGRVFGEGQAMLLPDILLTGKPYPIKAMIISGSNPALNWPNSTKVGQALRKLDFLVVMDLFMTETAKLAHIVLPAATFLERLEVIDRYRLQFNLPYTMMRRKAVELEGPRPDLEFWMELARRMGYEEYFPWKSSEEIIDYSLEPSGLTVAQLEKETGGMFYGDTKYRGYEQRGFRTPTGKFEIYSETLEKMGYEPLPSHREPLESPISTPDLYREYPLILTTGARTLEYLHSQLRDVPRLHNRLPEPVAEIHPDTAVRYSVSDGDLVSVETKRGSVEIRVKVTEDIMAEVVSIPHGWAQANVNILTDETPADPVTGTPGLKALLCRIRKI
jgi:anaerobic selenocysteine-containing dehydrogenase